MQSGRNNKLKICSTFVALYLDNLMNDDETKDERFHHIHHFTA